MESIIRGLFNKMFCCLLSRGTYFKDGIVPDLGMSPRTLVSRGGVYKGREGVREKTRKTGWWLKGKVPVCSGIKGGYCTDKVRRGKTLDM